MSNSFTIKVFFRGDWCPWCNGYLRDFNSELTTIKNHGGSVVGITSQVGNQSAANNNLDFDVIVDEKNVEAKKYNIFVTPKEETPLKDVDGAYVHGMVQPGVVIEDADGKILYRWAIEPSQMNLGGATDRPLVSDILGALEHILAHGSAPGEFKTTNMDYLEKAHPDQYKIVQDYIASMMRS
ncbi:MAG: redoxin domain-containing protein [Pseudomonadota bacterium]